LEGFSRSALGIGQLLAQGQLTPAQRLLAGNPRPHSGLPSAATLLANHRSSSCYCNPDLHSRRFAGGPNQNRSFTVPFPEGSGSSTLVSLYTTEHQPLISEGARSLPPPRVDEVKMGRAGHGSGASSVLGAGRFGEWVVTHSRAGSNLHDHRPAIASNELP